MRLRKKEIRYIGHILTQDGIKSDPKKVETIINMPSPTDVTSLKRFLGMVSYLQKFLPNISQRTESLRMLERKDQPWMWNNTHEKDFIEIKRMISSTPILRYFDSRKDITI